MDTGASVNIIDGNTYNKIKENVYLEKSNTKIFSFQNNKPL